MRRVDISSQAQSDITTIAAYGLDMFGEEQALLYQDGMEKQFELLAHYPELGRIITSTRYPKARRFGYGQHIIIYTIEPEAITIRRILGAAMSLARYI